MYTFWGSNIRTVGSLASISKWLEYVRRPFHVLVELRDLAVHRTDNDVHYKAVY